MSSQVHLSVDELATACGISRTRIIRLVRLGLVEPVAPEAGTFDAGCAARVRRMLRLHGQLGVNLTGAAIVVDLLERLERLETELAQLRNPKG